MRELVTMWRDSRMVMLVVVLAAAYAVALIPFKGFVIVPGYTTARPGNVLPVVFGLLFGPAAAWGSAFGNLFSDAFGGTLTAGSAFGFVGNFFYGYVGYALWGNLGRLSGGGEPDVRSVRSLVEYLVIAVVAAAGTAAIIGWGLDVLGVVPFPVFATIVFVNNLLPAAVLGPPLLFLGYPRVAAVGARYPDILSADDLPAVPASRGRRAGVGLTAVSLGWLAAGLGVLGPPLDAAALPGSTAQAVLGAVGFLLLVGCSVACGERLSAIVTGDESPSVEASVSRRTPPSPRSP